MSATVEQLAQRLENDIRSRGLPPGFKYLNSAESAQLLGTSVSKANRVLQRLAEQEIVVRRRSSGTFVGPAMSEPNSPGLHSVAVLYPASGVDAKPESLMGAVTAAMPDVAEVRFVRVPREGDVEFVHGLLDPIRRAGQLAGVVSISCSRDVYAYLGDNDYPLVVMGTLYPGQSYPSVDTDEYQAGLLATQYLVERGHQRVALLSKAGGPGDSYFHDGVSDALTTAGLPPNALLLRIPEPEAVVINAQVRELFEVDAPPTGFILRVPEWADIVADVAAQRGLSVPQDIEIVFQQGSGLGHAEKTRFPHVRPALPYGEIAALTARMMTQVRVRAPLEVRSIVIPFELQMG